MENLKKCSKCGQIKPLSDFGKASKEKSGLRSQCKECDKIEMRIRRKPANIDFYSHMGNIVGHVYETYDYDMFHIMDKGNRAIDHEDRIVRSIEENGALFSIILVNEKFEIIDGQNRFYALRKTGNPIHYVIKHFYGVNEVRVLNSNGKNWGKGDYINSYADTGSAEYIAIRKFMDKYSDFPASIIEYILRLSATNDVSISSNRKDAIRRGVFTIKDIDRSERIACMLMKYKQFHKNIYRRSAFVVAIIKLERDPNFDNEEIIKKIKLNPRSFTPCVNSNDYVKMIEDINNYRRRDKIRFNVF